MSILDDLTKSLVDLYANKLDEQEKAVLVECLEILANDQKYNKFQNYFPDDGEFRRELYPRHIEFFKAGTEFTERGFIAGNRCITPWTYISTPKGEMIAHEALSLKGVDVLSWDGEQECIAQASGGFLKCIEPAYRVVLQDGSFFDCTKKHRVLVESGWMSLDQLVSLSSGLRYNQKLEDYQANCVEDGYLCDQQLLFLEGIGQELLPKGVYAQRQSLSFSQEDARGRIFPHNQTYQKSYLLSTEDEDHRFSALFGQFLGAYVPQSVLPLKESTLSVVLSGLESSQKKALMTILENQTNKLDLCCELQRFLYALDKHQSLSDLIAYEWQSPCGYIPVDSSQELFRDADYIAIFFPFEHPPLVGGKDIIAIVPLGFQPIVDLSVDVTKNYSAGGVFHHNTGKSEAGCYETVCHATGLYPDWWEGRKFDRPLMIWVGGDTATTLRDIVQKKLVGEINDPGSGMIPKETLLWDQCKSRRNVPEAMEILRIKHITGGVSTIVLKSYEQGRKSWQGSEVDFIWIDEEADMDVYSEAMIRLMTTNGSMIMTFTPLSGTTEVVMSFLDNSQETESDNKKWVTICGWKDVPHITEEMKQKMLASTPPNLREARSEGKPTVGAGRIYPIDEKDVKIADFQIPKHYVKLYGMDVGWKATAACWGAWDRDNDVIYIYSEYKRGGEEGLDMPLVHASTIKTRGEWIKGTIDPASRGRQQSDGEQLYMTYKKHGLKIYPANNSVETGIFNVWERLNSGRLKIFSSCSMILREMSLYHRDDNGKIVKTNDHLLDCLRYLVAAESSMWSYPQAPENKQKIVNLSDFAMRACT